MIKKFTFLITLAAVFLTVLITGGVVWWKGATAAPNEDASTKRFVIKKRESAEEVGKSLAQGGFIKNAFAFKLYLQAKGLTKDIPAGEFNLSTNLSLSELIGFLLKGPSEIWVTIPEGFRREEIVKRFVQELQLPAQQAGGFEKEFLYSSSGMEGFLFPDTYLVPKNVAAGKVVELLRNTFDKKFDSKMRNDLSGLNLSRAVILASIIERETKTDSERPVVAGILLKRLEADWPLQADATIQYAIASDQCLSVSAGCEWWPKLTRDDYDYSSSYNTYEFAGLPPGPISNPGLSSLGAVVYSQESEYWYYIHDSEGKIHYARSLEEHNINVARYLR